MSGAPVELKANFETSYRALDELHGLLESFWQDASYVSARDRILFTLAVAEIAGNVVNYVTSEPREWQIDLRAWNDRIEAGIHHGGPVVERALDDAVMPGEDAESGRGLALANMAAQVLYSHQVDPEGSHWRIIQALAPA